MMAPVPLLTANGRCGLGEGTFATTRGKGRDAPKPVVRVTAFEPPGSTEAVRKRSRANKAQNCFLYCPSSDPATALFVSTLTKSRRTFYAQIECVCFHTAWTLKRHPSPRQRMTGAVGGGHSVGRGGRWQSAGLPTLSPLDLPRDRAFQSAHCEAWIGLRTVFVNQQIGRAPSLLSRHQRVVRPELPDGRASQVDLSGVLM
jgi:hypothetical protein